MGLNIIDNTPVFYVDMDERYMPNVKMNATTLKKTLIGFLWIGNKESCQYYVQKNLTTSRDEVWGALTNTQEHARIASANYIEQKDSYETTFYISMQLMQDFSKPINVAYAYLIPNKYGTKFLALSLDNKKFYLTSTMYMMHWRFNSPDYPLECTPRVGKVRPQRGLFFNHDLPQRLEMLLRHDKIRCDEYDSQSANWFYIKEMAVVGCADYKKHFANCQGEMEIITDPLIIDGTYQLLYSEIQRIEYTKSYELKHQGIGICSTHQWCDGDCTTLEFSAHTYKEREEYEDTWLERAVERVITKLLSIIGGWFASLTELAVKWLAVLIRGVPPKMVFGAIMLIFNIGRYGVVTGVLIFAIEYLLARIVF